MFSALVLAVLAAGVAAKRVPKLAAKTALVSIATTLVAGALFIAQYPGVQGASVDRGVAIFVLAIVVGAIAPLLVLRARSAADSAAAAEPS